MSLLGISGTGPDARKTMVAFQTRYCPTIIARRRLRENVKARRFPNCEQLNSVREERRILCNFSLSLSMNTFVDANRKTCLQLARRTGHSITVAVFEEGRMGGADSTRSQRYRQGNRNRERTAQSRVKGLHVVPWFILSSPHFDSAKLISSHLRVKSNVLDVGFGCTRVRGSSADMLLTRFNEPTHRSGGRPNIGLTSFEIGMQASCEKL